MPCGFADNQATTEPLLIAVSALSALSAGATQLARLGRAVHSRSCVIMSPMGADARVLAIQAQCLADDIEVKPEMAGWSDTELVAFFESGGRPAPACVSSGATMRVLCLHGGGANRQVMEFQTALLRSTLGPGANFDYLEGDRPWKDADVEPGLRRMFGDGPYFGWYGVEHDGPTSDAGGLAGLAAYMKVLEDVDNVTFTYSGVELAVAKLEAHIAQNGPVDAIVGFSQGAIVATLATALSLERQSRGDGPGPSWSRVVLVCGMPPRDSRYLRRFFTHSPLDFPATLVFGKRDPFHRYGQRLKDCFRSPTVLEHEEGHKFPSSKQFSESLAQHLREVM